VRDTDPSEACRSIHHATSQASPCRVQAITAR